MTKKLIKNLAVIALFSSLFGLVSCAEGPHEQISYQLLKKGLGIEKLKTLNLDKGRANYVLFSNNTGFTQITDGDKITYTVDFILSGKDSFSIDSYSDVKFDEGNTFYANTSVVLTAPEGESVSTFVTYDPYLNVKNWINENN